MGQGNGLDLRGLLSLDQKVKEALARSDRAAALRLLEEMERRVRGLGVELDWSEYRRLKEEGLLGAALQVLHEAVLVAESSRSFPPTREGLEKLERLAEEASRSSPRLARFLEFLADYLEAVREFSDVYSLGDLARVRVHLRGPREAWIRMGCHHARARYEKGRLIIDYVDHDGARADALASFLQRLGLGVEVERGMYYVRILVEAPVDKARTLARALAATTSLDLEGREAVELLRSARSPEELVEARRRLAGGAH